MGLFDSLVEDCSSNSSLTHADGVQQRAVPPDAVLPQAHPGGIGRLVVGSSLPEHYEGRKFPHLLWQVWAGGLWAHAHAD